MTYFHMGKPHTIIGAVPFHFWVRNGIRWVQNAIVAKQTVLENRIVADPFSMQESQTPFPAEFEICNKK